MQEKSAPRGACPKEKGAVCAAPFDPEVLPDQAVLMSRALASAATFSLPVMKARRSGPHFHSAGCPTTLLFCDAVIEARIGQTSMTIEELMALRDGSPVVQRLDRAPEPLRGHVAGDSGVWVLAAPDASEASLVVLAARPYTIRFTATELNRLAAVLDCRRLLALVGRPRWRDEANDADGRMPWGQGLASNA